MPPTRVKRRRQANKPLEGFGLRGAEDDARRGHQRLPKPGWVDPDLTMPGQGDPAPGCGDFYTSSCSADYSHPTERGLHQCATRNCPHCAKAAPRQRRIDGPMELEGDDKVFYACGCSTDASGPVPIFVECQAHRRHPEEPGYPDRGAWMTKKIRDVCGRIDFGYRRELRRPTPDGNGRLDTNGHQMDLRTPRIYSGMISVPPRRFGYTRAEERALRRRATKALKRQGLSDIQIWAHAFRHDGSEETTPTAYNKLGLHYHFLGLSRWAMLGELQQPARGRPPLETDAKRRHAFDGKRWTPIKSRRVPMEGWVWKVIWFAQPMGRGMMVRNLEHGTTDVKTGLGFANYLKRIVEYNFHHATFYNAHYHPEDGPYGQPRFVRTPGRYATPSSMPYGRLRDGEPAEGHEDHDVWKDVDAVWGAPKPACSVCGAPMIELYDDPLSPAARLMARIQVPR